ncbi:hypothetical protein Q1695_005599 [Nippostrongylus brasiliensis]|nr:hypothetical protein Q1695_005599 [Nippostrongylus brasiliensis]
MTTAGARLCHYKSPEAVIESHPTSSSSSSILPRIIMADNDPQGQEEEVTPDYSKYGEDSVPPPEKEVPHTHPGRPDLDYDDRPVGPAPEE